MNLGDASLNSEDDYSLWTDKEKPFLLQVEGSVDSLIGEDIAFEILNQSVSESAVWGILRRTR